MDSIISLIWSSLLEVDFSVSNSFRILSKHSKPSVFSGDSSSLSKSELSMGRTGSPFSLSKSEEPMGRTGSPFSLSKSEVSIGFTGSVDLLGNIFSNKDFDSPSVALILYNNSYIILYISLNHEYNHKHLANVFTGSRK